MRHPASPRSPFPFFTALHPLPLSPLDRASSSLATFHSAPHSSPVPLTRCALEPHRTPLCQNSSGKSGDSKKYWRKMADRIPYHPNCLCQSTTCDSEPATYGDEPATLGNESATLVRQPATLGSEPATCGSQTATPGDEPATCDIQSTTLGDEPATYGSQSTLHGKESTTLVLQPTISGKQPAILGSEPTTCGGITRIRTGQTPATRPTNDRQPLDRCPTVARQPPNHQPPPNSHRTTAKP